MPRTADHAAAAERWLATAEGLEPTEPSTMALIAQTHALLALASHLGAAAVRPSARASAGGFVPDPHRDADEAAIDRVRAASATNAQRGIPDEEPGWHPVGTHFYGDGHDHGEGR